MKGKRGTVELEDWIRERGIDRLSENERAACEQMTDGERELFVRLRRERDEWQAMTGDPVRRYRIFMDAFGGGQRRSGK